MTDEDKNVDSKKENQEELSPDEEDKKELYNAIKELKPEEASDNIKAKILQIAQVHLDYKNVENEQYGKEFDTLQDQYDKKYITIYSNIDEIVKSTSKIEIDEEEKQKYGITDDDAGKEHEIEDYWQKVINNSRYFTINDKDKAILKYIKKVQLVKSADNLNNFRVDFIFSPNEFFTEEVLSKSYEYDKDSVLKTAKGTTISWVSKEKNPTIEKIKKKIKKGKKVFHEEKEQKVDSFFSFFSQVTDMTFLQDEVTFFKEDLFVNQLEYYLDIVSKTKNPGADDDEDDDGDDEQANAEGGDPGEKDGDGKKKECEQQ